ncbi:hypothetical protein [Streptomyces sp. NPDC002671]
MTEHDEPDQAPPWNPSDGPVSRVWSWPPGVRPALWVKIDDEWIYSPVRCRYQGAYGRWVYHVDVAMPGETSARHREYPWPQEGRLKVAHGSAIEPSVGTEPYVSAEMPTGPHMSRIR